MSAAMDAVLDLLASLESYKDRVILDRLPTLQLLQTVQAELLRLQALAGETEKLTDEQAEAMLKRLAKHYRQPVMPVSRYCEKLRDWGRCIDARARRMSDELLPHRYDWDKSEKNWKYTPEALADHAEYGAAEQRARKQLPSNNERERKLDDLIEAEAYAGSIQRVFLNIEKSNLLARTLYAGEKVRTKMCPEHKGRWSGIEWSDNACPHRCQLTGWIQEEADQGKPLPGVQAVQMVPTGNPGEVTMIRDVDGEVLGKAVLTEVGKP